MNKTGGKTQFQHNTIPAWARRDCLQSTGHKASEHRSLIHTPWGIWSDSVNKSSKITHVSSRYVSCHLCYGMWREKQFRQLTTTVRTTPPPRTPTPRDGTWPGDARPPSEGGVVRWSELPPPPLDKIWRWGEYSYPLREPLSVPMKP